MAHSKTWNENAPAGSDNPRQGDDEIRDFKVAIRERLAVDHFFTAGHADDENVGQHSKVTLRQGASPTEVADKNILFSEDVDAVPQVKCKHELGYEEQITGIGKYDQGVIIERASTTTVDVNATQINIQGQIKVALNVTINFAGVGANGLDAGSIAADTWYYLWAIYDTTNSVAAGLASLSSTAPTMPANYVLKRLIGYCKTASGAATIDDFIQSGNHFRHIGAVGTQTTKSATWIVYKCNDTAVRGIPPGVRYGIFKVYAYSIGNSQMTISMAPFDKTNGTMVIYGHYDTGGTGAVYGQVECMVDSSQQLGYLTSNVGGAEAMSIAVSGFICSLF